MHLWTRYTPHLYTSHRLTSTNFYKHSARHCRSASKRSARWMILSDCACVRDSMWSKMNSCHEWSDVGHERCSTFHKIIFSRSLIRPTRPPGPHRMPSAKALVCTTSAISSGILVLVWLDSHTESASQLKLTQLWLDAYKTAQYQSL